LSYFAASVLDLNTAVVVATALIIGFFTLIRGRADVWKSNYEGEKERAENLQEKLTNEITEHSKTKEKVVRLESQPNVQGIAKAMKDHDDRAAQRNEKVIKVLEAIAKKLK